MTLPLPLKELLRRIEAKTEKTASCWLWLGSINPSSGPMLGVSTQGIFRHLNVRRILHTSFHRGLIEVEKVRMRCGVKNCIAPEHMLAFTGSPWNRKRLPSKPFLPTHLDEVVLAVVHSYEQGERIEAIATRFDINCETVRGWVGGHRRRRITKIAPHRLRPRFRLPGRHKNAKLIEAQVVKIIELARSGLTNVYIGQELGINAGTVAAICRGETWKWLTRDLTPVRKETRAHGDIQGSALLTWQEVLAAVGLVRAGYTQQKVADAFGVWRTTITSICTGRGWKWLTGPLTPVILTCPKPTLPEVHPDDALVYQHWKGGQSA